jgi:DNA-binding CsgD family transcriptional regulator
MSEAALKQDVVGLEVAVTDDRRTADEKLGANLVKLLREWFRKDGAEGETVHKLCDLYERQGVALAEARMRCAPAPEEPRALSTLSPRELDVVRGLQRGKRLSTLARDLCISHHTARNHLKHVFVKLGVHSQVELLFHIGGVRG